MKPILTRCGNRCDLCLAYKPNILRNPADRQILSDGWFKYFGFRVPPEEISCDGCMAKNPTLLDKECPVRPCVIEKGMGNCSQCPEYVCDRFKQRMVVYEEIREKVGTDIPEEDYLRFIRPYENKQRLDELKNPSSR